MTYPHSHTSTPTQRFFCDRRPQQIIQNRSSKYKFSISSSVRIPWKHHRTKERKKDRPRIRTRLRPTDLMRPVVQSWQVNIANRYRVSFVHFQMFFRYSIIFDGFLSFFAFCFSFSSTKYPPRISKKYPPNSTRLGSPKNTHQISLSVCRTLKDLLKKRKTP